MIVYGGLFAATGALCFFVTPIASDVKLPALVWRGIGGPIAEEIVYRGLAIGSLIRIAGWRFLPAVLLQALVFGLAHAAQGETLIDSAANIAITGLGDLLFGWLFVRWNFNPWPAIIAHIGMNTLWEIFAFGDTAIGDWFGNAARLALIALLLVITYVLASRPWTDNPLQASTL
ncbi:MAG: CPBP family intramembrane glutamic endopeptidase [Pseudomonadota bacterium]